MDVASNKKRLAAFEDEQFTAMIAVETAEKQQKSAEDHLKQTRADTLADQSSLRGEYSRLTKKRERLLSEREVIMGSIEPDHIEMYNDLIKSKSGIAVTAIDEDTCAACGSSLRSATLQAARSPKEITVCPFCKRILYAG
jgi:predicted  nucleic acid-binding Zn-ribbon protein